MMAVKVPAFLVQHPAESLIAVGLLLGLLFISADGATPMPAVAGMQMVAGKN